jgi:hypothetical protein
LAALIIVKSGFVDSRNRGDIDERAKQLVLTAYRDCCRANASSRKAFDAAMNSYLTAYPDVSRQLASHAVAHILSTAGV